MGAVTFGGGYAMLPILEREIVENKKWGTEEELADYYAIGQCTPGVIAVNVATFIGRKTAGNSGGVAATLGVVFPSVVIITLLAGVIEYYSSLEWVAHAFAGIRVCVCVLIFNAVLKLFKKSIIRLCYFLKYNCNMLYYSLLVLKYKISTKKRAYFILTLKTNYLFFQNSHR